MKEQTEIPAPTMQTSDRGNDIYYQIAALVMNRAGWEKGFRPMIESLSNIIAINLDAIEKVNSYQTIKQQPIISTADDLDEVESYCEPIPAVTMKDLEQLGYISNN